MLADLFSRHERVALMYSGGKDSLACLHLCRDYLDKLCVVWVNTGANFPEITESVLELRSRVPNFIEVRSDQPKSIAQRGRPTDVLPVQYTQMGQAHTATKGIMLRSYMDCCAENVWAPAADAIAKLGFTAVIRGQRNDEGHRAPISSGHVENGVEYVLPIESWSRLQVLEYLESVGVDTNNRLSMEHSSLDCWDCTAYCDGSQERMKYIKANHPEKYIKVVALLKQIDNAVTEQMSGLRALLTEENHGL
jgi:phosphoadenosine phosphosulfate reductase